MQLLPTTNCTSLSQALVLYAQNTVTNIIYVPKCILAPNNETKNIVTMNSYLKLSTNISKINVFQSPNVNVKNGKICQFLYFLK